MKRIKLKEKPTENDPRIRVCTRAWINLDGLLFLGPGKIRLLHAVDEVGSISGAARKVGLSYRAAWNHIDAMNNRAGAPLVVTSTGGEGGGGAQLTDLGRNALEGFEHLEKELERFRKEIQQSVAGLFNELPALGSGASRRKNPADS